MCPSTVVRIILKNSLCVCLCQCHRSKKKVSYRSTKISNLTLKEDRIVNDSVLPESVEHILSDSKVKPRFLTKLCIYTVFLTKGSWVWGKVDMWSDLNNFEVNFLDEGNDCRRKKSSPLKLIKKIIRVRESESSVVFSRISNEKFPLRLIPCLSRLFKFEELFRQDTLWCEDATTKFHLEQTA